MSRTWRKERRWTIDKTCYGISRRAFVETVCPNSPQQREAMAKCVEGVERNSRMKDAENEGRLGGGTFFGGT